MSTKLEALKRAFKAAKSSMRPQRYGVRGKTLVCRICGHNRFHSAPNVVTSAGLACAECNHYEFFWGKVPDIIDESASH